VHTFTVNYLERDGRRRGQLVNVGFFAHSVPRLIPWCRLLGHRPVVAGTDPIRQDGSSYVGRAYRWVCCDRCGVRGDPQGSLDPQVWAVGDRYAGDWLPQLPAGRRDRAERDAGFQRPGPIERRPDGALGGQLLVGGCDFGGVGWEFKVGNCASEHTLAAQLNLGWLGALYLHTERFGTGVQRRLNPTGYESRITGVRLRDGRLEWRLWSKRDSGSRYGPTREPWWRNGEISLRWRDRLWGPKRYAYTDVPDGQVNRIVRMPEGDYLVRLKLQQVAYGRRRGRRKTLSWSVDWSTAGAGIPVKAPGRGRISGSAVDVSERAVRAGTWPAEACTAIAATITGHRTSYDWDPIGRAPVNVKQVTV
jgi:hypothetical protein